jgi:hypothetical protein
VSSSPNPALNFPTSSAAHPTPTLNPTSTPAAAAGAGSGGGGVDMVVASASWPDPHEPERIIRNILGDNPRVTLFPIPWDAESAAREEAARDAELRAQKVQEEDEDEEDDDEIEEEEMDDDEESYNSNEEMTDAHDLGDDDRSLLPSFSSISLYFVLIHLFNVVIPKEAKEEGRMTK